MKLGAAQRKLWLAAVTLTVALTISGVCLMRPTPAKAAGRKALVSTSQSAGPLGATRGQSILIGLLLPAVQRTQGAAHVTLRLTQFPSGKAIAEHSFDLQTGGPGAFLAIHINKRGQVLIDGQASNFVLGEGERLNVVGSAELEDVGDNALPPDPCATLQVFNGDTGHTTAAVQLNFLPAVQRTE